ncbi:helix-turn-helix domain-containing protein [Acrocarpospora sp. B8E8]|uniref:TetR/AcrR family transcriptional regulator n=1 Tax=Acrocarpospora sp. B8E8 TaxID=3153572 RepID=UPI00325DB7C2
MTNAQRVNRGPSAAAENRAALIAAARAVFATAGYDAPLSAVARRAGVGQGSLYRHFPNRMSLAVAVFEDNITAMETLAAEPGSTLEDILALLTDQAIASTAFIDMISPSSLEADLARIDARMTRALADKLDQARQSGVIRPDVGTDELRLAISMIASLLAKTPEPSRRPTATRAWLLLRRALT